jgi:hypothetical protein
VSGNFGVLDAPVDNSTSQRRGRNVPANHGGFHDRLAGEFALFGGDACQRVRFYLQPREKVYRRPRLGVGSSLPSAAEWKST